METIELVANIVTTLTIIASIIAILMTRSQIKREASAVIASNHLELRKLFSEETRNNVHKKLRPGGKWCENQSGPQSQDDWIAVEDYLGIFETAEHMLRLKTLDEELFKRTYLYRLNNIICNQVIMNKINTTGEDWTLLFDLFRRYNLSN